MQKDFLPYYNLWTLSDKWFKNIEIWMYSDWEKIDAPAAEKFVEEGFRTLTNVMRYFKEKEINSVQKIAE
jgi:dynein heavy chain